MEPDSCFMTNVRSFDGGGEPESDFVEMGGEAEAVETPVARLPRCLMNRPTIGSLSSSRVSSMPKRTAAASIICTCWCFDNKNLVAD